MTRPMTPRQLAEATRDPGRNLVGSIGWFDSPGQDEPAFDPAENGTCPLCQARMGDERRLCRSMMPIGGRRSYFFSYHERCKDMAALELVEEAVVDAMFQMDGGGQ